MRQSSGTSALLVSPETGVNSLPEITAAETSIRRIMQLSTVHGAKQVMAERGRLHVNQISKQASGDDCLSIRLFMAWMRHGGASDSDRGAAVAILLDGEPEFKVETARIYTHSRQRYLPGMAE
jgi:hypothetical protein